MKNSFLLLALLAFTLSSSFSQETIPAAGGNAEGSGGSVSYSIGQLFFMTHTGADGFVSEGVQQPWEISVVTGIQEAVGIDLIVSAFPNPATDYLILMVDNYDFEDIEYFLYDVNGRLLKEGNIITAETSISMINLVPAVYFLKIIQTTHPYKEIKTFRIIKN